MGKLKPGDPLSAISAREYNRHVDAADWYERTQRLGARGGPARSGLDGTLVRVKNSTGSDFGQYRPVGLGAPQVALSDGYAICAAATPSDTSGVWGIAIDPIPNGEIGRVKVTGAVAAYVTIADTSHTRATVGGGGALGSDTTGSTEIIYQPGSTGEQLCFVRFGSKQQSSARQRLHSYTTGWYGTIPNGGDVNVPMWDADTIIQSSPGIFTFNGTDFDRLKSLVTGLMIATASIDVEYASSGSSTDGVLVGSVWESTGTWFTGGQAYGLTQSYVRYSKGCVTNTTMFQVAVDQEIWLRLSTGTGYGYFWGTTSDMTVNNVRVSLVHVTDDLLTP